MKKFSVVLIGALLVPSVYAVNEMNDEEVVQSVVSEIVSIKGNFGGIVLKMKQAHGAGECENGNLISIARATSQNINPMSPIAVAAYFSEKKVFARGVCSGTSYLRAFSLETAPPVD